MVDYELKMKTYLIIHDKKFILLMQSLMGETPKSDCRGFPQERLHFDYVQYLRYGELMMSKLPEEGVGVKDRGFAGLNFI